jgi:uncharacterized membrane protein
MWFIFGLIAAITESTKNVLAKQGTKSFNSWVMIWAWVTYSLIVLIPLFFIREIPHLDQTFWIAFTVRAIFDFLALVMYMESIKRSDLSLTLPLMSLSPLFVLLSGFILNGEVPSLVGGIGVGLIIIGTYFLNFKKGVTHWFEPFLAICRDRGSLLMLGVAAIWGMLGGVHKLAIQHSDPYFYTALGAVVLAVLFTPFAFFANRSEFKSSFEKSHLKYLVPMGLLDGIGTLAQNIGQSISLTVYLISVKRLSIIFSALLGFILFKEKIRDRMVPICLMVAGVILIALS